MTGNFFNAPFFGGGFFGALVQDDVVPRDSFAPGSDVERRRRRESPREELRKLYLGVRADVVALHAEELEDQLAETVAPYTSTKAPDLPPASMVDWEAAAEDLKQVMNELRWIAAKVAAIRRQELDDEDAELLLL